jgi:heme/copper-type cytochrome/quinol oxidase subunit 2
MSAGGRIAAVVGVIVIAVVGFIVLKPSDDKSNDRTASTTTAATGKPAKPKPPAIPQVTVKGGKPDGGIKDLTFNKGDTVQFKVVSDVADEVHVHGYDVHKDVAPGQPTTFKFPGKIDGEFVVELESRGEQIASLKVNP